MFVVDGSRSATRGLHLRHPSVGLGDRAKDHVDTAELLDEPLEGLLLRRLRAGLGLDLEGDEPAIVEADEVAAARTTDAEAHLEAADLGDADVVAPEHESWDCA